jgi:hypothetical protein
MIERVIFGTKDYLGEIMRFCENPNLPDFNPTPASVRGNDVYRGKPS